MKDLPLWFLIVSLFLPRIALLVSYFQGGLTGFGLHGWIPPAIGVIVPRALVLVLIFQSRGICGWLLVHAIFMGIVYAGAGKSHKHH